MNNTEPVLTGAGVTSFVSAVFAMLVVLDVINLTETQIAAIMAVVTIAANFLVALWQRSRVTPVVAPKTADGKDAALVPLDVATRAGFVASEGKL
jgi:hypothetical protein